MPQTYNCDENNIICKKRTQNYIKWEEEYRRLLGLHRSQLRTYLDVLYISPTPPTKKDGTFVDAGELKSSIDKVVKVSNLINKHLEYLNKNNDAVLLTAADKYKHNDKVKIKTNNRQITYQDGDIIKLNTALTTKERQIRYTIERNRNKRVMVVLLILINVGLIYLTYYLYNKV